MAGCASLLGPKRTQSREAGDKLKQVVPASPPTIDLVFMVDQSQSMGGGNGEAATDPAGIRFSAVKYAIENLKLKGTGANTHRVGLVEFGTDAPKGLSYPMTVTSDTAGLDKMRNLLVTKNLVWTSFTSGLQRATDILEASGAFAPNHRPAIIVFTDGTPEDRRKLTREQYFAEIQQYVKTRLLPQNCIVYVAAIDASGNFWEKDKASWGKITDNRAYSISNMDELKSTFNDIVRDILQLPKLPKDVLKEADVQFEVGPYLDQLEFHVFGSTHKGFELRDSSGDQVKYKMWTSPDYSIYTVAKPKAGTWTYKIIGKSPEPLTVYRNEIPVRPCLILPRPSYPAGKPIQIIAKVQYADGTPLKEIPSYPIRVTSRIDSKGDATHNLTLLNAGDGTYSSSNRLTLPITSQRATVSIALHAGTSREYQSSDPIIFTDEPYFDVTAQTGNYFRHYGDFIAVKAQLYKKTKKISGDEVFQSPTAVIRAQLTNSPSGEQTAPVWLDPVGDAKGAYQGTIPVQVRKAGYYTITYAVGGTDSRTGQPIPESIEDISFSITPTWLDRAITGGEYLATIVLCLIVLFAIALIAACIWAIRLPKMRGGNLTVVSIVEVKAKKFAKPAKGRAPKTSRKTGGLQDLITTAQQTPTSQSASIATASTPNNQGTTTSSYPLSNRKSILCHPGRLLFIHRGIQSKHNLGGLGKRSATDMSKQLYVIRYYQFPFFYKKTCESGGSVNIGRHKLTFM